MHLYKYICIYINTYPVLSELWKLYSPSLDSKTDLLTWHKGFILLITLYSFAKTNDTNKKHTHLQLYLVA